MPDPNVNTVFTAQDKVSATVKKIRTELGGFQKSVGGVKGAIPIFDKLGAATGGLVNPTTLAIGAVVGLAGGLVHAAKASAQEEVGIQRLNAALRANVSGFDGSTAAIEKAIRQRELLAFSDDKLRESLSLLVPATKNVDEALRLQAIAMDLARLRGTDLAETTVLISKVYQGNLTSLKRFGINLKGVSTSTEALAKIQELAAGQAEAYGNTLSGKSESLDNKLGNIEETIGSLVLPKLTEMTDVLLIATDAADALSTAVGPQLTGPLGDFGETITSAFRPDKVFEFADAVVKFGNEVGKTLRGVPVEVLDRGAEGMNELASETNEVTRSFKRAYDPTADLASAMDTLASNAEDAADELAQAIYGPDILKGRLAELTIEADETEKAIRKLAKKKDLTKEDRLELKQLRGDLAETNADILVTAAQLKVIGEPLPKGLERSINRIIDRQDTSNAKTERAIRLYRFWLGLTGGYQGNSTSGTMGKEKRAAGGPVRAGRRYTVGEHGPEELIMAPNGAGGFVLPNPGRGGSGGGGPSGAPVVVAVNLDGRTLAEVVDRRLYYAETYAPRTRRPT